MKYKISLAELHNLVKRDVGSLRNELEYWLALMPSKLMLWSKKFLERLRKIFFLSVYYFTVLIFVVLCIALIWLSSLFKIPGSQIVLAGIPFYIPNPEIIFTAAVLIFFKRVPRGVLTFPLHSPITLEFLKNSSGSIKTETLFLALLLFITVVFSVLSSVMISILFLPVSEIFEWSILNFLSAGNEPTFSSIFAVLIFLFEAAFLVMGASIAALIYISQILEIYLSGKCRFHITHLNLKT